MTTVPDNPVPASNDTVPTFSCRDPLQAQFWDQRFAQDFTPWDRGGWPQQLQQFVTAHIPLATLIPGCGAAYEVALFTEHQWPVRAIDFSAEAIASAERHLQTLANAAELTALLEQADFFNYTPPFDIHCIYERAFLCALPPKLWPQVAARWAQLLPPHGLLIGYFHIDADAGDNPKGPPFRITQQRLDQLLGTDFICLENTAASDSIAVFSGKEQWQVWRRKG